MSYKPSQSVTCEFTTQHPSTGAATNADSLPVGTFARNGTDDGTVTVTVTNVDTGRYKAAFTLPSGAAAGDTCSLSVAATVNSIAGKGIVCQWSIDTKITSDLHDLSTAQVPDPAHYNNTRGDNLDNLNAAVTTRMATFTLPSNFSSLVIDSTGRVNAFLVGLLATALTEGAGGQVQAAFKKFFDVAASTLTTADVNQTGDAFARLGAAGAGLTALGDARIAHLDADVTSRLAAGSYVAPDNADIATILTDAAAIKLKTDNLPAAPAATGDAMTLTTGERTTLAGVFWNTLTSALTTAGSIGKRLVDFVTTLVYVAPDNTDIAAIRATTDGLVQTAGKLWVLDSSGNAIASATAADIVTAMAAHVTEGTYTWDDVFRLMLAAESGKLDGAGTTTIHIRDTADTKNRVTATVDSNGNRTAVTRNLT